MNNLMESIKHLENIAKERLQKNVTVEFERLKEVNQLIRYGVCTCQCHFSTSVYHSAMPCCGNAKLKPTIEI